MRRVRACSIASVERWPIGPPKIAVLAISPPMIRRMRRGPAMVTELDRELGTGHSTVWRELSTHSMKTL